MKPVVAERGETAEATGGRKPAAQAHRGRASGGHPGVEGGGRKKVVSPQARREAVLVMQVEVELSQRRACGLMELYRATCRYQKCRSEDRPLRVRLRELAEERRRFGYRRLQVLLEREGWQVNHKRVQECGSVWVIVKSAVDAAADCGSGTLTARFRCRSALAICRCLPFRRHGCHLLTSCVTYRLSFLARGSTQVSVENRGANMEHQPTAVGRWLTACWRCP